MRALFEKDLRLILIRKSTLVIFLVIGVIFTWSFSSSFSGAYLTMLGTMLALSTISYDDSDNCMAFLFTLPCTRKQYVLEKYLFVYGFSFLAGLVGLVIIIATGIVQGNPVNGIVLVEALASEIPILVITGGLMIPLQLKFGPEKSRIVLIAIIGIIMISGYLAGKSAGLRQMLGNMENSLDACSPASLLLILLIVLLLLSVVSILITSRIMEKKEY